MMTFGTNQIHGHGFSSAPVSAPQQPAMSQAPMQQVQGYDPNLYQQAASYAYPQPATYVDQAAYQQPMPQQAVAGPQQVVWVESAAGPDPMEEDLHLDRLLGLVIDGLLRSRAAQDQDLYGRFSALVLYGFGTEGKAYDALMRWRDKLESPGGYSNPVPATLQDQVSELFEDLRRAPMAPMLGQL